LLKKDAPWEWSSACQDSFTAIKQALTSTKILTHYDPKLPIGLACDASSVGIRAVIYHIYPNGTGNQSHMLQRHYPVLSVIIYR